MEFLWSPWRYDYIASAGKKPATCVFCVGQDPKFDAERLILFRGIHNFIILNLFPYTSGHLMVAPFAHIAEFQDVDPATAAEMMDLSRRAVLALTDVYRPEGFNMGMNLGYCAGAGVREHLHLHIVPRWVGDSNFVSVIGETRVLPEELHVTHRRLSEALLMNSKT
jgi:ATP adenylyltransferase